MLLQQHYVGKVGKSITFVLYIIPIYCVPNNVEIGHRFLFKLCMEFLFNRSSFPELLTVNCVPKIEALEMIGAGFY